MSFLALSKELLPVSWSQLHICAYQGEVSTLERLLVIPADSSSNVDLEDAHGRTALCIALQNRRTEAALLLVENGASLEKALSSKGDLVTSSILYECGVQLLKRERTRMKLQPFPAFLTAVACNSSMEGDLGLLEAAVSVLESSAKKQDCIGLYPVHYAVMGGHIDCLETLLSHGADPDTVSPMNKSTPLHLACRLGHSAIVALLLDSILHPESALNRQNPSGCTPLHLALIDKHWDIVSVILNSPHRQLLNVQSLFDNCGYSMASLLQHLRCNMGTIPCDYQQQIPCLTEDEATSLLFCSISDNCPSLVQYAIEQGANIDYVDPALNSPLMLASRMGLHEVVNILISHNVNVCHTDNTGRSALHCAAREGWDFIVSSLLSAIQSEDRITAALLGRSQDGYTPLELALMHQQRSVVDLLLQDIRENTVHVNWVKLLCLAVSWADVDLLKQLSAVFPSNWADKLPGINPPSPVMTSSRMHLRQSRVKRGKPFTTVLPDLPYYPVHLAATLGNISTVQFILSQSSERKRLLQWKDASGRTVASLLGQLVSSDTSLEREIMEVMRSELQLPDEMSFEWAVLHYMITSK